MILKSEYSVGDIAPCANGGTGGWLIESLRFTPEGCAAIRKKTTGKKSEPRQRNFEKEINFSWGDTFWTLTHAGSVLEGTVAAIVCAPFIPKGRCRQILVNGVYPVEECFHSREEMVTGTFELIRQRRVEDAEFRRKDPLLYEIIGGAE
jgi:hypothetical protein